MEQKRLFIATDISEEVRSAIKDHVGALKRMPAESVRWEKIEKIHLTLKFLGDTDTRKIPDIGSSLSKIASEYRRFDLILERTGVFPNPRNAKVLWIGIQKTDKLDRLYADIENALAERGFTKENRRFSPHITIGRIRDPRRAKPIIEQHIAADLGTIKSTVDELVLYESVLRPGGALYTVLYKANLAAP